MRRLVTIEVETLPESPGFEFSCDKAAEVLAEHPDVEYAFVLGIQEIDDEDCLCHDQGRVL